MTKVKKVRKKNKKTATAKPPARLRKRSVAGRQKKPRTRTSSVRGKQKRKKSLATLRRSRRKATKFRASAVARKALKKKPVRKKAIKKVRPRKKVAKRKPVKKKTSKKPKSKKKVKPRKKIVKKIRPKRKMVKRKPVKKKKIVKKAKPKKVVKKKPKPKKKAIKKQRPIKRIKPKKKARPRKKPKKRVVRKKPRKRIVRKKKIVKRKPATAKPRKKRKRKKAKPRVYVGKGPLDQLFESQAKVKLLRFFFRNTEEIFQPKEIFKRLRSNITLLRQEMKKLEKLGLLKQRKAWLIFEKKRGGIRREKKTVWHLNPNFDFFNELRSLVLKSAITSKDDLVERAKKLGNIKLLLLTGVFTGEEGARADLLIVGDRINQRKLNSFIKDVEADIGKEINCVVMTTKEFNYRYDMYDRFVRDLIEGKSEILVKRLELW